MTNYRIVETDNFDGDYPGESFLNLPMLSRDEAQIIADVINSCFGPHFRRFWKVVRSDYVLAPGFEP